MNNKVVNSLIALLAGRPEDAREMLRSPELKGVSIPEVQAKLEAAVGKIKVKAAVEALRGALLESLKIQPPTPPLMGGEPPEDMSNDDYQELLRERFFAGVVAVENIIQEVIEKCETL